MWKKGELFPRKSCFEELSTFLSAICICKIADSCRAVQILITTSCSTYVKLFERGLNESFIASVFCDQELDGQG